MNPDLSVKDLAIVEREFIIVCYIGRTKCQRKFAGNKCHKIVSVVATETIL